MTLIINPQFAKLIAGRIRPRSEWYIGLHTLLPSDLPFVQAAANGIDPAMVLNDPSAELPFTGAMLGSYITLVETLLAASTTNVVAAYQSAVVRGLDVIITNLPTAGDIQGDDPVSIFKKFVQPRLIAIRMMNYWFANDAIALSPSLAAVAGADNGDTISEDRAPVLDLTVGSIRIIEGFQSACIGPSVNTSDVSYMTEAGCGIPLQLR